MNLSFFLHITDDKKDKQGYYPIKAQLDCNSNRVQFGIDKQRCAPAHWCKDLQRAKPDAPNSEYINLLLNRTQARFASIRLEYEKSKQAITVKELHRLLTAKEPAKFDLNAMIDKYIAYNQTRQQVGKITQGTLDSYTGRAKIWKAYFAQESITDITGIKRSMQDGLGMYVLQQGNANNYACDVITGLKSFLNFCLDNEWIEKNVFLRSSWRKETRKKFFLEASEIEAIRCLELKQTKLQQTRDFFLLSCATGLAYSDLKALSKEQVRTLERDYLFVERQKTNVQSYIPIFEEASNILKKYDYCLNMPIYKTYNSRLKVLRKLAGIEKRITTHTGRKTFGNTMLNTNNVPLETVSKMMCHANIQTTAKYYTDVNLENIRQNTAHLK